MLPENNIYSGRTETSVKVDKVELLYASTGTAVGAIFVATLALYSGSWSVLPIDTGSGNRRLHCWGNDYAVSKSTYFLRYFLPGYGVVASQAGTAK